MKKNVINYAYSLPKIGGEIDAMLRSKGIYNGNELLSVKNLSDKESLTMRQIVKIAFILGCDKDEFTSFVTKFQSNYNADKRKCTEAYKKSIRNFKKLRNVIPLMRDEFNDGEDKMDDLLDYFGVDSEDEIFAESEATAALFRKQNNVKVDPINLRAWLRRGELDFAKMEIAEYDENALKAWIDSRSWEAHLADAEYFMTLPNIFKKFGVALVFVPFLPHTVYGAVRWIEGKPLIEISDRNKDLASCWFTLFHEVGHVILHNKEDILEGKINDSGTEVSIQEREANKFANKYLFHGDELRKEIFNNVRRGVDMTAKSLANKHGVNEIFASYWLRKAQYLSYFQKYVPIDFVASFA